MISRVVLFVVVVFCSPYAKGYTIGIPEYMYGTDYQAQVESAFTTLYASIGVVAKFEYLPFSRMVRLVDNQQLDAIAYQLTTQAEPITGAVRVPEPITEIRLFAACLESTNCHVDKDTRFVVVRDVLFALELCNALVLDCLQVKNPNLARKALRNGLADVHIMQRSPHIKGSCLAEEGIKLHPIAHTEVNIYHYVAAQHSPKTELLANNLKALKRQASRERIEQCNLVSSDPLFL